MQAAYDLSVLWVSIKFSADYLNAQCKERTNRFTSDLLSFIKHFKNIFKILDKRMPGKICPFCGNATLFGNACTTQGCGATVTSPPPNGGRGGRGKKCPFCKTMTLFGNGTNGCLKCSSCNREFAQN
ncbi:hypothetical protein [Yokenella regensburgei]|uniref:hypothetical protein n=1 Tax=Yokenella regensburgei TaxID=158877 RepID=UPI001ED8DD1F|nr:hypothetical protein [Yokenella regensburgei]